MVGEATDSADHKAAWEFQARFLKIIKEKGYKPQEVFNVDETGLILKKMPSRNYQAKEEKRAPGFKAANDGLTLVW